MTIDFSARNVSRCLLWIVAILTVLNIVDLYFYHFVEIKGFDYVYAVDFDTEGNIPTFYSACALLLAALVLFVICKHHKRLGDADWKYWFGMALIFTFLSIDEATVIHEEIGDFTENFVKAKGHLYYPWFISYTIMFFALAMLYLRFYLRLPKPTQIGLFIAATTFLTGAVGLEVISANEAYYHGTNTILYTSLYTVEEVLEMVGVIILIRTLINYFYEQAGDLTLTLQTE